ncbi:MAG: hypothetical protein CL563_11455 [Alphaproteobacteria bacterium]|nr:hypothetical protein [Alphaproteobacteria bacterium]
MNRSIHRPGRKADFVPVFTIDDPDKSLKCLRHLTGTDLHPNGGSAVLLTGAVIGLVQGQSFVNSRMQISVHSRRQRTDKWFAPG